MTTPIFLFDPPPYGDDMLPKWREYLAMLERTVNEYPDSRQAQEELEDTRLRVARYEQVARNGKILDLPLPEGAVV